MAGPRAAMELAAAAVGPYLTTLPHGETDRPDWVIEFIEVRAASPDYRVVRRSRMSQPRPLRPMLDPPRLIARASHRCAITAEGLHLPYMQEALATWPIFREVAEAHGLDSVRPQYGIAGPLDVASFTWLNPMKHYDAECQAAAREVACIHALTNRTAVFQLEIPAETVAVAKAPQRLRERIALKLVGWLREFVEATPGGTTWIVHLCVGNKHDLPLVDLRDVGPLVDLANALIAKWPHDSHLLDSIHLPFGSSIRPAPTAINYYKPLHDLLPIPILAGIVRSEVSIEQNRRALGTAEGQWNRPGLMGVSTPCGMGRTDTVANGLRLLAQLATAEG